MKLDLPEGVCDIHVHVGDYFSVLDLSSPLETLRKTMEKYRMEAALVFSGDTNPEKETRRIINALRKDRGLFALIRSDPENYNMPKYQRYLKRLLHGNDRIIGLKVNPSTEKHRITDSIYTGVLEILNDNNAVLLLHCGRWLEMSGWQYGIEIAKLYPKMKVILAHMGGTHPDLSFPAIEASREINNVYTDTSQTRQIVVLKRGIERLGAERILFGTDLPWGEYLQNIVGIISLGLDESTENKILRENFKKLVYK